MFGHNLVNTKSPKDVWYQKIAQVQEVPCPSSTLGVFLPVAVLKTFVEMKEKAKTRPENRSGASCYRTSPLQGISMAQKCSRVSPPSYNDHLVKCVRCSLKNVQTYPKRGPLPSREFACAGRFRGLGLGPAHAGTRVTD